MNPNITAPRAEISLTHPKYRPDIDGLRAVAVLSVVWFHAFPTRITGGFVGVDIFFVISGFLISSIIFENLERASFSFATFYARRIKRIFPSLFVVLIVSYGFGWFVLFADEYKQLGKHVAGGAGFISNFLLWRESGYFDNAAETKPMLHLWSLAIEEQFYIFWPLLLAFAWKRRSGFVPIIVAVAVTSFTVNIYLVAHNPTAAFYSPLSRFWELMIGCVLAYITLHKPELNRRYKNAQSVLGASLLILGVFFIDDGRAFPGWWALLPTLGGFLLISAGPAAWLNDKLLSNRILVWFGLISYPLYLWHWPLLSFARIAEGTALSTELTLAAVLTSILLSWLTYKLLELPIRTGGHSAAKTAALSLLMGCIFLAGVLGYKEQLTPRYTNPALQSVIFAANEWEYLGNLKGDSRSRKGIYYIDGPNSDVTLFIGDSHVAQYGPRIGNLLANNARANSIIFTVDGGCLPIPGVFEDGSIHAGCAEIRAKGLDLVGQDNVKVVVIGADWNDYFLYQTHYPKDKPTDFDYYYLSGGKKQYFRSGDGKQLALAGLENFLRTISAGKKVYLLLDNPQGNDFDPHNYFSRNRFDSTAAASTLHFVDMDPAEVKLRQEMIAVANHAGVEVIDPALRLCDEGKCDRMTNDGKPIYKDNSHLSSVWVKDNADYLDRAVIRAKN